jgi:hypothetical protein
MNPVAAGATHPVEVGNPPANLPVLRFLVHVAGQADLGLKFAIQYRV